MRVFLVLMVFNLAAILAPVSALVDPPDMSEDQEAPEVKRMNDAGDRFMIYGTGGVAFGGFNTNFQLAARS